MRLDSNQRPIVPKTIEVTALCTTTHGDSRRAWTFGLPVNGRTLYQLSYGTVCRIFTGNPMFHPNAYALGLWGFITSSRKGLIGDAAEDRTRNLLREGQMCLAYSTTAPYTKWGRICTLHEHPKTAAPVLSCVDFYVLTGSRWDISRLSVLFSVYLFRHRFVDETEKNADG